MKKPVVLLVVVVASAACLFGQQGQSALPAGSVPPATVAPAAASPSPDATVVEEIIVRINNSIISLSDLKKSQEQLAAELSKQDPNVPAEGQPKELA